MTRNEWKTRGKRVARATVAALVSLWVLYVVAINVFLSTSLFDRVVNRDPVTLDVHFEQGWSLWPTRIHAKRLAIRSSDSNVMWRLELDEVTFDVALRDLPRRRLTVERARGRGVGMRIQTKRTTYPDDADEIRDLPPIEGFPAFAVRPAGPHHPELWDDDQYRLITVSLDDVSAEDVREIWIDGHRFAGHASVAGRFYLKPLRAVAVGPVRVEIRSGEVQRGRGEPLVRDLGGRLEVTASRFDPREVEENEALRFFEVTTKLRGRSIPLARLADAPFSSAYVDGVVDARDLTLRFDRGRLTDGSTAEVVVEELHVARGGYLADGAVALHASVVAGRLRARTEPARWSVVRADGAAVLEVGRGSASLDTADLDLAAAPFRDLHLTVEADDARAPSAWILPGLDDGAVTFALHAEIWPRAARAAGAAKLEWAGVRASHRGTSVAARGRARAAVASLDWDRDLVEGLEAESELAVVVVRTADGPLRQLRAETAAIRLRADRLELAAPERAIGDLDLDLAGVTAAEGIRVETLGLSMGAGRDQTVVDAKVEGGRITKAVRLSPAVRLTGDRGAFRGSAHFASARGGVRGGVEVRAERLGVETPKLAALGDARLELKLAGRLGSLADLSGSRLEVSHLDVRRARVETKDWAGAAWIERGTLARTHGEPILDADVRLAAEDARPLLGLLGTPAIAGSLLEMPRVTLRGHATATPQGLLLEDVDARGGDVTLRGSYAAFGAEERGAFVVEKGPLAMGIRLGKDGAHPHFFGLQDWLGEEERKAKALPRAVSGRPTK